MRRGGWTLLLPLALAACGVADITAADLAVAPSELRLSAPQLGVAAGGSATLTVSLTKDCLTPAEQVEARLAGKAVLYPLSDDGCRYVEPGGSRNPTDNVWVGTSQTVTLEPSPYDQRPEPFQVYDAELPAGFSVQWAGQPAGQQRGEVELVGGDGSVSTQTLVIRTTAAVQPGSYTLYISEQNGRLRQPLTVTVTPAPAASVTGVSVSASPGSVASGGSTTLSANVSGTGNFDPAVTWSIVEGGGSLSAAQGSTVTLSAPTGPATVTVRATSVADPSRSGTVSVNVSAPPPPPSGAATLSGTIGNWDPAFSAGAVTLTTPNADHTGLITLASTPVGSDGSFALSLPVPPTLDPLTIDTTDSCTVDIQPAGLQVATGSLFSSHDGETHHLESASGGHLAFLAYVDRAGTATATCTSNYTQSDGVVITERFEYDYAFEAPGWYPVYLQYSEPAGDTHLYTFSSGPLGAAPQAFVEGGLTYAP